jgi:hypothetical protein
MMNKNNKIICQKDINKGDLTTGNKEDINNLTVNNSGVLFFLDNLY